MLNELQSFVARRRCPFFKVQPNALLRMSLNLVWARLRSCISSRHCHLHHHRQLRVLWSSLKSEQQPLGHWGTRAAGQSNGQQVEHEELSGLAWCWMASSLPSSQLRALSCLEASSGVTYILWLLELLRRLCRSFAEGFAWLALA